MPDEQLKLLQRKRRAFKRRLTNLDKFLNDLEI